MTTLFALIGGLAWGCSEQTRIDHPPLPVLVFRIDDSARPRVSSFAGEVVARYESILSFRVPGKLTARLCEIGERVRSGQVLARLDPTDYSLAAQGLQAQLAAARADRDLARDERTRYGELLEQKIISSPDYDRRETAHTSARERVRALEAQLAQANNQLSYAELRADRSGVITALPVEAGAVIAAGQPVAKIAQLDQKEVQIQIPEQRLDEIRNAMSVEVIPWADENRRLRARIREIAPSANPESRSFRAKVSLLEGLETIQLGMTATVAVSSAAESATAVPFSAILSPHDAPGETLVFTLDPGSTTVKAVRVRLGVPLSGNRVAVTGLSAGQWIVSAGVQRLRDGQAIRVLGEQRS